MKKIFFVSVLFFYSIISFSQNLKIVSECDTESNYIIFLPNKKEIKFTLAPYEVKYFNITSEFIWIEGYTNYNKKSHSWMKKNPPKKGFLLKFENGSTVKQIFSCPEDNV